jgi:hypothetical protein
MIRSQYFIGTLLITSLIAGCSDDNKDSSSVVTPIVEKSNFAVIGDMPYGTSPTDTAQFLANPAYISGLNADKDLFATLHVGDIHSGKEYCTESYNRAIYNQWTGFKMPVIYTPGDNEWTDCHKAKEGGGTYNATTNQIDYKVDAAGKWIDYEGGDPVKNLDLVRTIFFPKVGQSLGTSMTVHSQALEYNLAFPSDRAYIENIWFEKSNVLFVTLNIPGGSNNDTDPWYGTPNMSITQANEVALRSAANIRWLDTAFKQAIANHNVGVVIQLQADMWDTDGAKSTHISEYKQFIDSIATNAKTFNQPVLLLNGDSHVYRSDNPLLKGASCVIEATAGASAVPCTTTGATGGNPSDPYLNQPFNYSVPNFHRLVVHGSTLPFEYLKLTIDPTVNAANSDSAFGPFSWKRIKP